VLDHGRLGRIVADRDLGPALLDLIGDEAARRSMAATGRECSRRYGWDEVAAAYERVYDDARARRGRRT
jgi:hypothetical protein